MVRPHCIAQTLVAVALTVVTSSALAAAPTSNVIEAIRVDEGPAQTVVRIQATTRPTFTVFKLANPTRLFIDVVGADVTKVKPTTSVANGVLDRVVALQYDSDAGSVGRVVVEFQQDATYDIRTDGSTIELVVDGAGRSLPELKLKAAQVEAMKLKQAVARERALLAQLRDARKREEQLRDAAVSAREQEETLNEQVSNARREAERLSQMARAEADKVTGELQELKKSQALEKAKAQALARAVRAEQARKKAMEEQAAQAAALKQATEQALAHERARLAAVKVATERAVKERKAVAAASTAAEARRDIAKKVEVAKQSGESGDVRRLQKELAKRDDALAKANKELSLERRHLEQARLAAAQAAAKLEETNGRKLEIEAARRKAAEEALAQEKARATALSEALEQRKKTEIARRQQELAAASEQAQRTLAALEKSLAEQRSRVSKAQERAEVEQARIDLIQSQLDSERKALAALKEATAEEKERLAGLKKEVRGLETRQAKARAEAVKADKAYQQQLGALEQVKNARRTEQKQLEQARELAASAAQEARKAQLEASKVTREAARSAKGMTAEARKKADAAQKRAAKAAARAERLEAKAVKQQQKAEKAAASVLSAERKAAAQARKAREAAEQVARAERRLSELRTLADSATKRAAAARKQAEANARKAEQNERLAEENARLADHHERRAEKNAKRAEEHKRLAEQNERVAAESRAKAEREEARAKEQAALADAEEKKASTAAKRAEEAAKRAAAAESAATAKERQAKAALKRAKQAERIAAEREAAAREVLERAKASEAAANEATRKAAQMKKQAAAEEARAAQAAKQRAEAERQAQTLAARNAETERRLAEQRRRIEEARKSEEMQRAEEARKIARARAAALAAQQAAETERRRIAIERNETQAKVEAERQRLAAERARLEQARHAHAHAKSHGTAKHTHAAKTTPKGAPAAAKAGGVRPVVTAVKYSDAKGLGEVRISLTRAASYEIVRRTAKRVELRLSGTVIPRELERSLDTSDFKGPVKLVSSFRSADEPGTVRVIVDLREDASDKVRVVGNDLVWKFDKPVADSMVAKKQTQPRGKPGQRLPPGVHVYPGAVAAQGGAVASKAGGGGARLQNRRRRKRKYTGKKINLTIKDADIQHVLTFLAKEGGVNIVASEDVKGAVTFHLENIPWDLALDMILKTQGYDYVKEFGVYRVAPQEDIQKEFEAELKRKQTIDELKPMVVRFVTVNYADLEDVAEHIKTVLSKNGTVSADSSTSTLIIKDIEEHVQAAEDIVRRLDVQLPQVLIEARIVEASTSFSREAGIQWGGNFTMSPAFGNPTGLAFPSILGVSGGADDATAPQNGLLTSNPNFAVNLPAAAGAGAGGALGLTLGSIGGAANLNLRLSAAEEEGQVKIISAPKILTIDGKKASIRQGVSIPISVVSANGVNTQFFNADLLLEVKTSTSPDGNIRMDLDITKNEPDFGQTAANGAPTIQKKEAHTSLLVRDGDTTVIGGIYTRNTGTSTSGVPFLSKIPILGWFFQNHRETDNRSELLIFITPRIANRRASLVDSGAP